MNSTIKTCTNLVSSHSGQCTPTFTIMRRFTQARSVSSRAPIFERELNPRASINQLIAGKDPVVGGLVQPISFSKYFLSLQFGVTPPRVRNSILRVVQNRNSGTVNSLSALLKLRWYHATQYARMAVKQKFLGLVHRRAYALSTAALTVTGAQQSVDVPRIALTACVASPKLEASAAQFLNQADSTVVRTRLGVGYTTQRLLRSKSNYTFAGQMSNQSTASMLNLTGKQATVTRKAESSVSSIYYFLRGNLGGFSFRGSFGRSRLFNSTCGSFYSKAGSKQFTLARLALASSSLVSAPKLAIPAPFKALLRRPRRSNLRGYRRRRRMPKSRQYRRAVRTEARSLRSSVTSNTPHAYITRLALAQSSAFVRGVVRYRRRLRRSKRYPLVRRVRLKRRRVVRRRFTRRPRRFQPQYRNYWRRRDVRRVLRSRRIASLNGSFGGLATFNGYPLRWRQKVVSSYFARKQSFLRQALRSVGCTGVRKQSRSLSPALKYVLRSQARAVTPAGVAYQDVYRLRYILRHWSTTAYLRKLCRSWRKFRSLRSKYSSKKGRIKTLKRVSYRRF